MKNIYTASDSDYLSLTKTWQKELSPWKAEQILKLVSKNKLNPKTIVEVGCGVGEILYCMNETLQDGSIKFEGYDVASDAINMAKSKSEPNISFHCKDFNEVSSRYDLLLMIDVFEHVPDYITFIENCCKKASHNIFHIPLDIHVSSILRGKMIDARKSVGHLHYFTKETAIATLEDAGLEVLDCFYTKGSKTSKKLRSKIANIPRALLYSIFPDLTVKLFGGYSLIVLTK